MAGHIVSNDILGKFPIVKGCFLAYGSKIHSKWAFSQVVLSIGDNIGILLIVNGKPIILLRDKSLNNVVR